MPLPACALAWSPKKSVLHQTISAIRPETWEAVSNHALVVSAKQQKLESGATVRIDSTVQRGADALSRAKDSTPAVGMPCAS